MASAVHDVDEEEDNTLDKMACIEAMISRLEEMPGASDVFLQAILSQGNKQELVQMGETQKHMLSRFEKTNEMLLNFNGLSRSRFEATQQEFRRHTQLLSTMKQDLDTVFHRIRNIKSRLATQYPQSFSTDNETRPRLRPPRPPQPANNRHSWSGNLEPSVMEVTEPATSGSEQTARIVEGECEDD